MPTADLNDFAALVAAFLPPYLTKGSGYTLDDAIREAVKDVDEYLAALKADPKRMATMVELTTRAVWESVNGPKAVPAT